MALGIGANTAVFSVVDGVLLKPLAYRDPDRIVTLATAWKGGAKLRLVTLPDFQDWHDQSTAFSAMAYYRSSDEPTRAGSIGRIRTRRESIAQSSLKLLLWRLRWAGSSVRRSRNPGIPEQR